MQRLQAFVKKEIVTSVSFVLAVLSMFIVRPDEEYLEYIHWSTLSTLLCLMLIMAGLRAMGVFEYMGRVILSRRKHARSIVLVLVGLCFFLAPFITNDVALITFVPFAIFVLQYSELDEYIIPTLALQTIAAHMGSMLTPIGNPHNIYLFGLMQTKQGVSAMEFMGMMLPFFAISGALLVLFVFVVARKNDAAFLRKYRTDNVLEHGDKARIIAYAGMFAISLLPVFGLLKWYYVLPVVLAGVFIFDRQNFRNPDYCLLFTFIFLFIFVGNIGRIEVIEDFLTSVVKGNELIVSVLASQVISNAPASILLAEFSDKYFILALGTDIGGLGTLIASMANLISFKHYAAIDGASIKKYILRFTLINVLFIIPMVVAAIIIL